MNGKHFCHNCLLKHLWYNQSSLKMSDVFCSPSVVVFCFSRTCAWVSCMTFSVGVAGCCRFHVHGPVTWLSRFFPRFAWFRRWRPCEISVLFMTTNFSELPQVAFRERNSLKEQCGMFRSLCFSPPPAVFLAKWMLLNPVLTAFVSWSLFILSEMLWFK